MSKIEEKSLEVQQELRESDAFTAFENSFKTMLEDDEARKLYEGFRDFQINLNEKQSQGIEVTEEEIEESRQQFEHLKENEIVNDFMANEYQLNKLIHEVRRKIMKPLKEGLKNYMKKTKTNKKL